MYSTRLGLHNNWPVINMDLYNWVINAGYASHYGDTRPRKRLSVHSLVNVLATRSLHTYFGDIFVSGGHRSVKRRVAAARLLARWRQIRVRRSGSRRRLERLVKTNDFRRR